MLDPGTLHPSFWPQGEIRHRREIFYWISRGLGHCYAVSGHASMHPGLQDLGAVCTQPTLSLAQGLLPGH